MRLTVALLVALPMAACAVTPDQVMSKPPYRVVSSTKAHDEVGQCIVRRLPATQVIPGSTETIVKMQGDGGPVDALWRIEAEGTGSKISIWRKNSVIWGMGKAEACF